MRLARIWMLIVTLLFASGGLGCKEDPMDRARTAHATEKPDLLEKALKEVLATAPADFEARRLMADVHRFRGEYQKTEEALTKLWEEKGFDDESKKVEGEEAAHRDLLENQFNELYRAWADDLDAEKEPEKFQGVVEKGLKWNPRSANLNRQLVDVYTAEAKRLAEAGDKLEAAETYEKIIQLRTMPATRENATKRAAELRREAFADAVKKRFDEEVKPGLQEKELWDEEKESIVMRIEADVPRRLRQSKEEDLAEARKVAGPAIRQAVATMVHQVTELEPRLASVTAVKMTSGDESLRRGKYEVSVMMTVEDIVEGAFTTKEKARLAAEKAAKEEGTGSDDDDAADEGDGGGADAGSVDGGTTDGDQTK